MTGQINTSALQTFSNFTGINYIIMPGSRIYKDGAAFRNLGTISGLTGLPSYVDTYNRTNGFFNLTLPGGDIPIEILVSFFASNNSVNYLSVFNVTLGLTSNNTDMGYIPLHGALGSSGMYESTI